jgi:hypothetical protein
VSSTIVPSFSVLVDRSSVDVEDSEIVDVHSLSVVVVVSSVVVVVVVLGGVHVLVIQKSSPGQETGQPAATQVW